MKKTLSALLISCCLPFAVAGMSHAATPDAEFEAQLRKILQQKPELVLDVLRSNSEVVLDIAQLGSDIRRRQLLLKQWKLDMETPKSVDLEKRPSLGAENAPVTLVAFSDFTCTYCRQASETIDQLLQRYPDQIRFVFKQSPQGKVEDPAYLGAQAFMAAWRQDPAKAWIFYQLLFEAQGALMADPQQTINAIAEQAGLDAKALRTDMKNKNVQALIEADITEADNLNFKGTPYFMVNDIVIRGALPLENFAEAVDMALQRVEQQKKP